MLVIRIFTILLSCQIFASNKEAEFYDSSSEETDTPSTPLSEYSDIPIEDSALDFVFISGIYTRIDYLTSLKITKENLNHHWLVNSVINQAPHKKKILIHEVSTADIANIISLCNNSDETWKQILIKFSKLEITKLIHICIKLHIPDLAKKLIHIILLQKNCSKEDFNKLLNLKLEQDLPTRKIKVRAEIFDKETARIIIANQVILLKAPTPDSLTNFLQKFEDHGLDLFRKYFADKHDIKVRKYFMQIMTKLSNLQLNVLSDLVILEETLVTDKLGQKYYEVVIASNIHPDFTAHLN